MKIPFLKEKVFSNPKRKEALLRNAKYYKE